ncbi:hypothetical protein [Nocardia sp. NBC_01730]|uniref:hypothetical protein n=1 Tax=Nocardia sp. NBC_01730 TaxID=2975998 RepID=UPI002E10795A
MVRRPGRRGHRPGPADIIQLVGDGVYLRALLGLPPIDPTRYRHVVDRLLER